MPFSQLGSLPGQHSGEGRHRVDKLKGSTGRYVRTIRTSRTKQKSPNLVRRQEKQNQMTTITITKEDLEVIRAALGKFADLYASAVFVSGMNGKKQDATLIANHGRILHLLSKLPESEE